MAPSPFSRLMLPAKGQRCVWSPQKSANGHGSLGRNGRQHASMGGGGGTLPISFRSTYWSSQAQNNANNVSKRANGQQQQPQPRKEEDQSYCTVEEIQLGKRQRWSPEEAAEQSEENHYEESDDAFYERAPEKVPTKTFPLPPVLPPPKPFAVKKKERRKITIFWPLLAVFLFCLIILAVAVLSLWLASTKNGESSSNRSSSAGQRSSLVPKKEVWRGEGEVEETTPVDGRSTLNWGKNEERTGEVKEEDQDPLVDADKVHRWAGSEQGRRKLRLFEVQAEGKERSSGKNTLLASARPLPLSMLSHNGVPVHPLQFQRLLRSHGVDPETRVVLYDRHPQMLWASYAYWIMQLFGHKSAFLLQTGALGQLNETMVLGLEKSDRAGTFRAQWHDNRICPFDDVLARFELSTSSRAVDIVDVQTEEEYNGKAALSAPHSAGTASSVIYGHIRSAINVPVERLLPLPSAPSPLHTMFLSFGLSPDRPVIVYDGWNSHRAAFVWMALQRANFSASLYFGAWPEWLIRAPDHLKVIPDE